MGIDPMVSRHEIGSPTQLSWGTGGYKTLCFQPGEGPSRGLLRDCTTSPINRFAALVPTSLFSDMSNCHTIHKCPQKYILTILSRTAVGRSCKMKMYESIIDIDYYSRYTVWGRGKLIISFRPINLKNNLTTFWCCGFRLKSIICFYSILLSVFWF